MLSYSLKCLIVLKNMCFIVIRNIIHNTFNIYLKTLTYINSIMLENSILNQLHHIVLTINKLQILYYIYNFGIFHFDFFKIHIVYQSNHRVKHVNITCKHINLILTYILVIQYYILINSIYCVIFFMLFLGSIK